MNFASEDICLTYYYLKDTSSKRHKIQEIQNPRLIIQGHIVQGYNILSPSTLLFSSKAGACDVCEITFLPLFIRFLSIVTYSILNILGLEKLGLDDPICKEYRNLDLTKVVHLFTTKESSIRMSLHEPGTALMKVSFLRYFDAVQDPDQAQNPLIMSVNKIFLKYCLSRSGSVFQIEWDPNPQTLLNKGLSTKPWYRYILYPVLCKAVSWIRLFLGI